MGRRRSASTITTRCPVRALVIARFTASEVLPSEDAALVMMMDFGGPISEANARFVRTWR